MMDAMSLRDLEYVVAVERERSITGAAASIPMAQPALSQAIARIERRLGVVLFRRTSRTVVPTEAGALLVERARRILGDVARAIDDTRATGGHRQVRIQVTEPSLTVPRRMFAAIRHALPDAAVHQMTVPRSQVAGKLVGGELTASVGPRERGPGLVAEELCREGVRAVFGPDHPLAHHDAVTVADVAAFPIVSIDPGMSDWNATVARHLARFGAVPRWTESSAFGAVAAADLVHGSDAVFLALDSIARGLIGPSVHLPIDPEWSITWFVNWRAQPEPMPCTREAVDAMRGSA
ncbi:LysR family transcriptional regulator [Tomitella fengzijianii]|uniref:LysR family transcriptional regulator n=2 Tax=Tomitella fengzijianii TaxID=2597660 RepID=A0A516X347_9ACTN|nr:LysR family transcriptional regulator [Tomitella fengzijianii]